jgi:hypothetical protein
MAGLGLLVLLDSGPTPEFSHAYPAPGPGCGDQFELEDGGKADHWDNEDYAGVHCYPDHVDIDAGHDPTRAENTRSGPTSSGSISSSASRPHRTFNGPGATASW